MRIILKLIFILLVITTTSCGSKKATAENFIAKSLSADKIVKNYNQHMFQQNSVRARIKVDYNNGKTAQSFIANLRMEKDKTIWITASILGVPLVKALITPDKVSYYEKINETYFEGDYSLLSDWLGTELNFDKLQNLLLGQAIVSMDAKNVEVSLDANAHLVSSDTNSSLFSFLYWINPHHFKLDKQLIVKPSQEQSLQVVYSNYHLIQKDYFPSKMTVEVVANHHVTTIKMDFNTVEFNQALTFPFEIPKGFKLISLN